MPMGLPSTRPSTTPRAIGLGEHVEAARQPDARVGEREDGHDEERRPGVQQVLQAHER